MKRRHQQRWRVDGACRTAVLLAAVAASLAPLCGCQSEAHQEKPTAAAAAAFKGAAPTDQDRKDMAKEIKDAAAYRRAHPDQYPEGN